MSKLKTDAESLQACVSVSVTDLRIGNYINDEETTHIIVGFDSFMIQSYWLKDKERECLYGTHPKNIKPIQLNEDWILKFGIGKQNGYPYKFLNGFLKIRNGIYFFKYYDLEVKLPFVHQLQNLHYALKGCDLQIGNLTEH